MEGYEEKSGIMEIQLKCLISMIGDKNNQIKSRLFHLQLKKKYGLIEKQRISILIWSIYLTYEMKQSTTVDYCAYRVLMKTFASLVE